MEYLFPQFLLCHGVNLLFFDIRQRYFVMSVSNFVPVLIVDVILFQRLLGLFVHCTNMRHLNKSGMSSLN